MYGIENYVQNKHFKFYFIVINYDYLCYKFGPPPTFDLNLNIVRACQKIQQQKQQCELAWEKLIVVIRKTRCHFLLI